MFTHQGSKSNACIWFFKYSSFYFVSFSSLERSKEDLDVGISNLCDLFIEIISGKGKVEIITKLLPEISKVRSFNLIHCFSSIIKKPLTQDLRMCYGSQVGTISCYYFPLDSALADVSDTAPKERLIKILNCCKSVISPSVLMERLSDDTLEQISLINSRQNFQKRSVRTKTRLFFKQQKFNLLREESEGYAKLIVELSKPMTTTDNFMTHVRSLIGYFDLDPNRVLDIILDACEIRCDMHEFFIELIKLYKLDRTYLTHILGHKFHFYQVFYFETS